MKNTYFSKHNEVIVTVGYLCKVSMVPVVLNYLLHLMYPFLEHMQFNKMNDFYDTMRLVLETLVNLMTLQTNVCHSYMKYNCRCRFALVYEMPCGFFLLPNLVNHGAKDLLQFFLKETRFRLYNDFCCYICHVICSKNHLPVLAFCERWNVQGILISQS